MNSISETSISSLTCFDAVMMDAVDSLANDVDVNYNTQVCQLDTDNVSSDMPENRPTAPSRVALFPKKD